MCMLFFLPLLERMRVDIRRVIDDVGMGKESDPAYIGCKQDNEKPFEKIDLRSLHTNANIYLFLFFTRYYLELF